MPSYLLVNTSEPGERALFVDSHEAAIASHVGGKDRRELPFDPSHCQPLQLRLENQTIRQRRTVYERRMRALTRYGMGQTRLSPRATRQSAFRLEAIADGTTDHFAFGSEPDLSVRGRIIRRHAAAVASLTL